MATVTAYSGIDLLGLSNSNFWYMGNMARWALGATYKTGDSDFNQSRGGETLLFEGSFTTAVTDPVKSVSILGAADAKVVTLEFGSYYDNEDALRGLEARSDMEAFYFLLFRDDRFILSEDADRVDGYGGNDTIDGRGGNDLLKGGAGNDEILGGTGRDKLVGSRGDDKLSGQEGFDRLVGGGGDDTASGGRGNDKLFGKDDDDKLYGNGGADVLQGGSGNDRLDGGGGDDRLTGGRDADRFVFTGKIGDDVVTDLDATQDKLVFDADLWTGDLGRKAMVNTYASQTDDGVLFEFDSGHSVLIENWNDPQLLVGAVAII